MMPPRSSVFQGIPNDRVQRRASSISPALRLLNHQPVSKLVSDLMSSYVFVAIAAVVDTLGAAVA